MRSAEGESGDFSHQFEDTMPFAYRAVHDPSEIRLHAAIVARRGAAPVHVERFSGPGSSAERVWLCVVTDDRPGLLSLISSVVLAHSLDIVSARVYCRERPGHANEAVDFLLVRALKGHAAQPLGLDTQSIQDSIEALLNGNTDLDALARQAAPTSPPSPLHKNPLTRVYFAANKDDVLVVESEDRRGLLLAITLTMFREGLTILGSDVNTENRLARDEFQLAEFAGEALSPNRRERIVRRLSELLAAV
jgi:UTP:GlnB (protein PII) uridylyltransferase